jgi:type VI secretion system secreted protein VgrG
VHGTKGAWIEHASQHSMPGPDSLPVPGVNFPEPKYTAVCKECLLKAMASGAPFGVR